MGNLVPPRFLRALRCAAALLACCACEGSQEAGAPPSLAALVRVSGNAPWAAANCAGPAGNAFRNVNAEVEPYVAIDPRDPKHLIGTWQQDRWSNGGATGVATAVTFDGGYTWTMGAPRLSICSGGTYQRATDPWVTISPNSFAYHIGYAFTAPHRAMLVSRSVDGGRNWSDPVAIQEDSDSDVQMDKETITADPADSNYVYAVWDRLTGLNIRNNPAGTGPAWFSRTTDGGATWEPARVLYDPGPDTQTVSNQIVVLPDGALVNLLLVITANSSDAPRSFVAVLRSTDRGTTWSPTHIQVAESQFVGVSDPKSKRGIRSGAVVPSIAVDRRSGALYVVWEDARFSTLEREGIAISKSLDGGLSWSPPVQVNGAPSVAAFTPAIAVAPDGTVGVTYYDFRRDDPADAAHLMVAQWLATSKDGGTTFSDVLIGEPFDLRKAAIVEGSAYFLGDYQALVHDGTAFLPFFTAVAGSGPSDIFFRPAGMQSLNAGALSVAAHGVQQLWRGARERWRFGTLFK